MVGETARLTLHEMSDEDLEDMARLLGDAQVMTYYPRTRSLSEAQSWIDWNRGLYLAHGFGLWVLRLSHSGTFIGDCGLTVQRVDDVDEVEIGYHLLPEYQGRGYATEAALYCRDLARDRFGVRRLIAIIDPANRPSRAVAEKLGLTVQKRSVVHGGERLIYSTSLSAQAMLCSQVR